MAEKHFAFFDASVYLGLYQLPPRDLQELEKLVELVDAELLDVFLPSQVADEFTRRRAKVVADALRPMRDTRLSPVLPPMVREGELFVGWKASLKAASKAFADILTHVEAAAREGKLPADRLVSKLFERSPAVNCLDLMEAAQTRRALGNPPGKRDSLGDAVSWEALLRYVPDGVDVSIVTSDADFMSPLDPSRLDEFLAAEWTAKKRSSLRLYRDLAEFLGGCFPEVRLIPDLPKHLLVEDLLSSHSFDESHRLVSKLRRYPQFMLEEAERLLSGGLENNQVYWLARDDDVEGLVRSLLAAHRPKLPPLLCAKWDMLGSDHRLPFLPAPTDDQARAWLSPTEQSIA